MSNLCSCCGQPLPEMREGIRLTPLKAHIFDVIKRAGADGVMIEDINAICFAGRTTASNVRNHVVQINDALLETDFRISGTGDGWKGLYRLIKQKVRAL
ncbi:hypothetical protein [Bradyrhizobium neotropicale]|uniref:hypothetical protein n=1 Tax=Bradyrhizobium neotropicale TaxID=1497615 RepID=UPI001AD62BCB|nr:hypothetical protein [Bradyrhizobium neotropicale]MBO4228159.1 hypothetical protein [Bradyrhizobium neotropicale]